MDNERLIQIVTEEVQKELAGKGKAGIGQRMRSRIFLVAAVTFLLVLIGATSVMAGSGTEEDPYIITTVEQLQEMNDELGAYYELGNDIDASATSEWDWDGSNYLGFEPIGTLVSNFTGSFDGKGYKITNLYINRPDTECVGLFGDVNSDGVMKNVGLENENVSGKSSVGGLVGLNEGTVSNSYSTGTVSSSSGNVGGLVGYNKYATVDNSYSTGTVDSSGNRVGGLVGDNLRGTVDNSYSTGSVSGEDDVGGLVGYNDDVSTVSNSYSTGTVDGTTGVGGLVGLNKNSTVSNSYSTGTVSGSGNFVGGLVGSNSSATVDNSYSTGSVDGTIGVGGLIGSNGGWVSNSYSTGSVSGINWVGGLVGLNLSGSVSNYSYSTGFVSGSGNDVGGLIGFYNGGLVSNSFWDVETSGQATSPCGTGKSTAEMKDVATYTDTETEGLDEAWDFVGDPYDDVGDEDIWDIDGVNNDGYPFLSWQVFTPGGGGIDHHWSWYNPEHVCAIATASYGTPMAEEVKALSAFRDEYLWTNKPGQALVRFYYRHSPRVADFIRDKEPLKAVIRAGLKPLVWVAEKATQ